MFQERTFAERTSQTAHRSLFREKLQRQAGAMPLVDWLVEEANLRGHFGVTRANLPAREVSRWLSDERLLVALLMPQGPLDVRLFTLVLRVIQKGGVDPVRLWLEARKERADATLYWLLERVPAEERNAPVEQVAAVQPRPPRGYRPLPIDYDPRRLIRRPATRESTWRAAQH